MAVGIVTGFIQVNTLRTNATLSQGKNVLDSWAMNSKTNTALGEVSGNINLVPIGANILIDPDCIDTTIMDNGFNAALGPSIVEAL